MRGWTRPIPTASRCQAILLFVSLLLTLALPSVAAAASAEVAHTARPAGLAASGIAALTPSTAFVSRQGAGFVQGGQPFRFIGTNAYYVTGHPAIHQCGPVATDQGQLDAWFTRMKTEAGATVIRISAQPVFMGFKNGGTVIDPRGMDRALLAARRAGIQLMPVLGDHWQHCDGQLKDDVWYGNGYRNPQRGQGVSYKEAVRQIVSHYRDEPLIFAWELVNEPNGSESAITTFATDMLGTVKSADPNHLVSLGGYALDRDGWRDGGFKRLNALPGNDFASYHDYDNEDTIPIPGEPGQAIARIGLTVKDANWGYNRAADRTSRQGVWEEWTRPIPDGATPFREFGLEIADGFAGTIYLDSVTIANRGDTFTFTFEDGGLAGFVPYGGATLANTDERAAAGSRSLKLITDGIGAKAIQNNSRIPAQFVPGATITWRVFVQSNGAPTKLAEALRIANDELAMPIIIAEHGECVTACEGLPTWTPAQRASNIGAKSAAFLARGGDGYVPWVWMPDTTREMDYGSDTGDPLLSVLRARSEALASSAPPPPPSPPLPPPAPPPLSTPPAAIPPSFTMKATASPASIGQGEAITVTVAVRAVVAGRFIVKVQVYDPSGAFVWQQYWADQDFASGETRTYPTRYVAQSAARGQYRIDTAVHSAEWAMLHAYQFGAAQFSVIAPSGPPAVPIAPGGFQYYPLPHPVRLLDTRAGFAACNMPNTPLGIGATPTLVVWGTCDGLTIPAGARAVVGNATAVANVPNAVGGFVTLWPSGQPKPNASTLNYVPGQIVPNAFTIGLGDDGAFAMSASSGLNLIIDVAGYYAPPDTGGLYYHPLPAPKRLLDTRAGFAACDVLNAPLAGGTTRTQSVSPECTGLPSSARAVVGNATVVADVPGAGGGYVTLWPSGLPRPNASTLNYAPGQVVPNAFTVGLGADGAFAIGAPTGVHLVVDLVGYYAPPGAGDLYYHPLPAPVRLLDTRAGFTACDRPGVPLKPGVSRVQGLARGCTGLPAGAVALTGNATVVADVPGAGGGYVTLWPSGLPRPNASTLNYAPGQVVPNAFTVGLGTDGAFAIGAPTGADLVIDIVGYFSAAAADAGGTGLLHTSLLRPARLLDTHASLAACIVASGASLAGTAAQLLGARPTCDGMAVPMTAWAIAGNAIVIANVPGAGPTYVTARPRGPTWPNYSTLNYPQEIAIPFASRYG